MVHPLARSQSRIPVRRSQSRRIRLPEGRGGSRGRQPPMS